MRILLIILSFLTCFLNSQLITVSYKGISDSTTINNPERGFYASTEVHSNVKKYESLDLNDLINYRSSNLITIILREFYLEKFIRSAISTVFLNNIQQDFNTIRSAGLKCILRFAYSDDQSLVGSLDANKTQILAHISQLKPFLNNNSDIIMVVQTGFIGTWGEWYYTDHFGYPTPSKTDYLNRKAIVNALLAALPVNRKIQLRTPALKIALNSSYSIPLSATEAFTGTAKARIGQHNDCFLADSTDLGTYENKALDYPWLAQETKYLPMGGETCAVNMPRSGCTTALAEMQKFHWTFLNIDYHPDVINGFRTNGCFTTIQNKLGYRFVLINGSFPKSASIGKSSFLIQLKLNNTGFSSIINARNAFLILRNNVTNKEYSIQLKTTNPLFWLAGSLQNITETITLPAGIIIGNYKLYLNLPDNYQSIINRSEYSIRLANQGLWETKTGYNSLLHIINLTN